MTIGDFLKKILQNIGKHLCVSSTRTMQFGDKILDNQSLNVLALA